MFPFIHQYSQSWLLNASSFGDSYYIRKTHALINSLQKNKMYKAVDIYFIEVIWDNLDFRER